MGLKEKLNDNLKSAMKNKDETRKNTIRMALSSIKLAEIDGQKELDEAVIISILHKEIKTREETIFEAKKASRDDMITQLEAEVRIINEFLPQPFDDDELLEFVKKTIEEVGAKSIKEMGSVMKKAIDDAGGRASNDRISKLVREILTS